MLLIGNRCSDSTFGEQLRVLSGNPYRDTSIDAELDIILTRVAR